MKYDPNRIPKVIIPLVLVSVIGEALVSGLPAIFQVVFAIAVFVAIASAVFYLITESGWRTLAKHFKATSPFDGEWVRCATGQMALVSVDHPDFQKVKMRFIGGSLMVAPTSESLHLSTMFSKLPILGLFFPALSIPWAAISKAHEFEAPGWFSPQQEPGTILQAAYDPNYTGKFIEIEAGEPVVFIQLPAGILGEGVSRLGLSS